MAGSTTAEEALHLHPSAASRCAAWLGALQCSREAHVGRGHVYVTGSWVPDKHGAGS